MEFRILVCGGRDYNDAVGIHEVLDVLCDEWTKSPPLPNGATREIGIISGMARGVDTIAARYAASHDIKLHEFPADWTNQGKKAGYLRNMDMLKKGKPNLILAFPGGIGTSMMVDMAIKYNYHVVEAVRDPLGVMIMGAKGSSSSLTTTEVKLVDEIKSDLYKKKYIERITSNVGSMHPDVRAMIYRDIMEEERQWLAGTEQAAAEYDEIQKALDAMREITGE